MPVITPPSYYRRRLAGRRQSLADFGEAERTSTQSMYKRAFICKGYGTLKAKLKQTKITMANLEARLKSLEEKMAKVKALKKERDARQLALAKIELAKRAARQKILAGEWLLSQRPELKSEVVAWLKNAEDRAIFEASVATTK